LLRCGSRAVAIAAVALLATGARPAVLKTIAIDGDLADWAEVLAEPAQAAADGPASGLVDRDAPVQSTGRDLGAFAWTYDATYLYFYVERVGNNSNIQRFWFYLDTDFDGLMETGEPVVGVAWRGSTGRTDITLHSYNAAAPGGDPLGDPAGLADGWDMPGSAPLLASLESPTGGSPSGMAMESRISWANLGVPAGTPMRFHVASSNSANLPSQVDDNMGGSGGSVGSTFVGAVRIEPDGVGTLPPAGFAVIPHTVTNEGPSVDRINLAWSASGDFLPTGVAFHLDADGDGALGPGDPLLADTDGDGRPDAGPLAPGASAAILAVPSAPAGIAEGQTTTVVLTASSSGAPASTDTATDVITVEAPAMTLVKSADRASAAPGDVITYAVVYTSTGTTDARQVVLVDAIPASTIYVAGSAQGPGMLIEFSHDGGAAFDASEAAPVTHIRWSSPAPLPPGATGSVSFQVIVL
jgi:uncharacterized repeat protein (TIGR01451 family)